VISEQYTKLEEFMKNWIFLFLLFICAVRGDEIFAQAQPQGEFHKYIVKKVDAERHKNKSKEWWGAGVICFSKSDIPRMGKTSEVEPTLESTFKSGDVFFGRVYLTTSLGDLPGTGMPEEIVYRFYCEGKMIYHAGAKGDAMPEASWSSWALDLPSNFEKGFEAIPEGKHVVRIEIWSSKEYEEVTEYKDEETDKTVGYTKENQNAGKFIASGEFTYEK
jgi:hypothetical protein